MIRKIEITGGFYTKIPGRPPRTVVPGENLTLVLGPNASGKSTLLQTMAGLCGIKNGGWSRYYSWSEFGLLREERYTFPAEYQKFVPSGIEAVLDWDKTPAFFYQNTRQTSGFGYFFDDANDSPDGITTFEDQIGLMMSRHSSGATRIGRLMQALHKLAQKPDLQAGVAIKDERSSVWRNPRQCIEAQIAYFRKGVSLTKPTLLLDEPEQNMDVSNQAEFWGSIVPALREKYQTVIASHSIFAIAEALRNHPLTTVVETRKGFLKSSKKTLAAVREALS